MKLSYNITECNFSESEGHCGNSDCILFMFSERLGIFQLNSETLIQNLTEII